MKFFAGLLVVLSAYCSLNGADVVMNAVPYEENEARIQAFEYYLKTEEHFVAKEPKELQQKLQEDWLLANRLLREGMTDFEKGRVVNALNRFMAKMQIKRIQDAVKIPDDVPMSYYIEHKNNYKLKPVFTFELYRFKRFDDALAFYNYASVHAKADVDQYVKDNNISTRPYVAPENRALPALRLMMKDKTSVDYFTYPVLIKRNFNVIYVDDIEKRAGYLPYGKVKKHILSILFKETYLRAREKTIEEERRLK